MTAKTYAHVDYKIKIVMIDRVCQHARWLEKVLEKPRRSTFPQKEKVLKPA